MIHITQNFILKLHMPL